MKASELIRQAARQLDDRTFMLLHTLTADLRKLADRIDFVVAEEGKCEALHKAGCVCGLVAMNLDDVQPATIARPSEKADGT